MKTIKSLLFIILFSPVICLAQDLDIFWGKEYPVKLLDRITLLGRKGNTLWGYKSSGSTMSFVKFSADGLQPTSETPLMGKKSLGDVIPKDYDFEGFLSLKNKLYISVSKYDSKADKNSIYAQEINEDGKLVGKMKKLSEIYSKKRSNAGNFGYYISKDSSKVVLVKNPPFEKYAGEKFGYKVFDSNLKEISNIELELPYKDKNFSALEYILSNDGEIYLLARIELERKEKKEKKKEGESEYYYEILAINPEGKGQIKEYDLKLPKKDIVDVAFSLDENKGILCAGFYGDIEQKGRKRDDINGIFYLRINKETKNVDASGTKPLDKDFIADLSSKKDAKKGRGIASTFRIKEFVRRSDGGAILVTENSYDYTVQVCTTDPKTGIQSCRTDYHYVRNNIVVININADGSIKWYTNIPKYQHTVNDGGAYSSFMFMTKEDKMYFIYNDNPKNMDPTKVKSDKDLKAMGSVSKSIAVLTELSESGKASKKTLFNNKENKSVLMPTSNLKIGKDEYIVSSLNAGFYCCLIPIKGAKMKMARFKFK